MKAVSYYKEQLAAERLRRVYEIAPPRVRRYLNAELDYVLAGIRSGDAVLELGCGYGRILGPVARKARFAVGIDLSMASLSFGKPQWTANPNFGLAAMDARRLGFRDGAFDVVLCIQNGISAFKIDPLTLMKESLRVVRPGGTAFFSSYSSRFWDDRLEWFRLQAAAGLVGEIDDNQTRDGVIVCKDGFKARTFGPADFLSLADRLGVDAQVEEVDGSSVFCVVKPAAGTRN
jgi:SAM-dependent methyltransferase